MQRVSMIGMIAACFMAYHCSSSFGDSSLNLVLALGQDIPSTVVISEESAKLTTYNAADLNGKHEIEHKIDFGKDVLLRNVQITVTWENSDGKTETEILEVQPTLFVTGTLEIDLVKPPRAGTGREAAIALYDRKLVEGERPLITGRDLFSFYLQARGTALGRIDNNASPSDIDKFDVKSVFKFLEAARELSSQKHVVVSQEAQAAVSWMSGAIDTSSKVVASSKVDARKIVSDIRQLQLRLFTGLWNGIIEYSKCPRVDPYRDRYSLLTSFQKELLAISEDTRLQLLRDMRITMRHVDDAINECRTKMDTSETIQN